MSGNQYVYVVEMTAGFSSVVQLVTKNRREAMASARRIRERHESQGGKFKGESLNLHPRQTQLYVRPGSRSCVIYEATLEKAGLSIRILITAWVIKWAKPQGPVRGTLKERMGDRSWGGGGDD